MQRLTLALLLLIALVSPARAQPLYKAEPGPSSVTTREAEWRDEARARDVPVKIYLPAVDTTVDRLDRCPLVVFSHGMGGSRENYVYFGRHLASHGYIVIHPQHAGSDTPAVGERVRERMRNPGRRPGQPADRNEQPGRQSLLLETVNDPENLRNRPLDISFVITQALKDAELGPRIDPERIAVAGHSFGSYTTLAVGGMKVEVPPKGESSAKAVSTTFTDSRVKALIAMSPQGSGLMGVKPGAWDAISVPTLLLTGTEDMPPGERGAPFRSEAFRGLKGVDAYLVTLKDATHMTFSGRMGPSAREREKEYIRQVEAACTAFLDAYLRGDATARAWVTAGMAKAFGDEATVETKAAATAPAPSPARPKP